MDPDGRAPAFDGPADGVPGSAEPDEPGTANGPPDGAAIDGDGDGGVEGEGVGEGVGEGEGDTIGDGVPVAWTGPGTYAMTAATMTAPVAIPANSPRTMARRGSMAGGYQYQAPEAGSSGTG